MLAGVDVGVVLEGRRYTRRWLVVRWRYLQQSVGGIGMEMRPLGGGSGSLGGRSGRGR